MMTKVYWVLIFNKNSGKEIANLSRPFISFGEAISHILSMEKVLEEYYFQLFCEDATYE